MCRVGVAGGVSTRLPPEYCPQPGTVLRYQQCELCPPPNPVQNCGFTRGGTTTYSSLLVSVWKRFQGCRIRIISAACAHSAAQAPPRRTAGHAPCFSVLRAKRVSIVVVVVVAGAGAEAPFRALRKGRSVAVGMRTCTQQYVRVSSTGATSSAGTSSTTASSAGTSSTTASSAGTSSTTASSAGTSSTTASSTTASSAGTSSTTTSSAGTSSTTASSATNAKFSTRG